MGILTYLILFCLNIYNYVSSFCDFIEYINNIKLCIFAKLLHKKDAGISKFEENLIFLNFLIMKMLIYFLEDCQFLFSIW